MTITREEVLEALWIMSKLKEVYPELLDNYDEMAIVGAMTALDKVKEKVK